MDQRPVITFAVGCFMFENRSADLLTLDNPKGKYLIQDWAQEVRTALEGLDGVTSIDIAEPSGISGQMRGSEVFDLEELHGRGRYPNLLSEREFVPNPSNGAVSFDVNIPLELQKELFYAEIQLASEHFHVDIYFGYGFPVAFVSTELPESSPSEAVILVREFLVSRFKENAATGPLTFSCLGPSPFWAEMRVVVAVPEDNIGEAVVAAKLSPREGYDRVTFLAKGPNLAEAYLAVQDEIAPILGIYYSAIAEKNQHSMRDRYFEYSIEWLVKLHKDRGVRAWFTRLRHAGRETLELNLALLHATSETTLGRSRILSEIERVHRIHGLRVLDPWIERELEGFRAADYAHLIDMVDAIGRRHNETVQVVSVLAASLAGGMAGAALAALVGG